MEVDFVVSTSITNPRAWPTWLRCDRIAFGVVERQAVVFPAIQARPVLSIARPATERKPSPQERISEAYRRLPLGPYFRKSTSANACDATYKFPWASTAIASATSASTFLRFRP